MEMLRAYCDASGKSDNPDEVMVTIGGVVSSLDRWKLFEEEWEKMLADFGVSELHMRHLSHFRGEYKGWEEPKRRNFLGRAVGIMNERCEGYIGSTIPVVLFEGLPEEYKKILVDPYYICFFAGISGLLTASVHLAPEEKVEMALDREAGFEGKAMEFWNRAKELGPAAFRERLGGLTLGLSSRETLPLQAADLVAYEVNKFNSTTYFNLYHGQPLPNSWPRWTFEQLRQPDRFLTFEFFNRETIRGWFGI